jgi:hypothetical protein
MRGARLALRRALLAPAAAALVTGVWAGLARVGFGVALPSASLPGAHGPLMICGFLGTLIALERAVAMRRSWAFAAPLAGALGAALLVAGHATLAAAAFTAAATLLAIACVVLLVRQPTAHAAVGALAAICFAAGALRFQVSSVVSAAVPLWMGFLVLTIASERLELSRLSRPTRAAVASFVGLVFLLVAGLSAAFDRQGGAAPAGFALAGIAAWLARHDVARRTARRPGLPRFAAACLYAGYAWLAFAGAMLLLAPPSPVGPRYDALLHAVFVGFVLSMIFAHAPIVLPAVARVALPFSRALYLPLALLHASLAARIAGDLGGWPDARRFGAAGNVVALALFVLIAAGTGVQRVRAGPTGRARLARSAVAAAHEAGTPRASLRVGP